MRRQGKITCPVSEFIVKEIYFEAQQVALVD